MAMAQLEERYWTAADVRELPEDGNRYECVDGALLVTPAPRGVHQLACRQLFRALDPFVVAHALGELLWSPADIELKPGALVQPDLFVARTAHGAPVRDWGGITGLLLAVEVLSPSSARFDRGSKREFYQRAGVAEYWIVDLDARLIERWRPADERPELLHEAMVWHPDGASDPLRLDLPALFRAVLGE